MSIAETLGRRIRGWGSDTQAEPRINPATLNEKERRLHEQLEHVAEAAEAAFVRNEALKNELASAHAEVGRLEQSIEAQRAHQANYLDAMLARTERALTKLRPIATAVVLTVLVTGALMVWAAPERQALPANFPVRSVA